MTLYHDILSKIKEYDTIIIHRHMRPDPDALGSQVGLQKLLQYHFPEKTIKATGYDEPNLMWLAQMDQVTDEEYQEALVIVCDTANTPALTTNATRQATSSSKSIIILMMRFTEIFLWWIQAPAVPVR